MPKTQLNGNQILDNTVREADLDLGLDVGQVSAASIPAVTTNFDNNLSAADDTVQKALDTLDELVASGSSFDEDTILVNQYGSVVTNGINVLITG